MKRFVLGALVGAVSLLAALAFYIRNDPLDTP